MRVIILWLVCITSQIACATSAALHIQPDAGWPIGWWAGPAPGLCQSSASSSAIPGLRSAGWWSQPWAVPDHFRTLVFFRGWGCQSADLWSRMQDCTASLDTQLSPRVHLRSDSWSPNPASCCVHVIWGEVWLLLLGIRSYHAIWMNICQQPQF